MTYWLRWLGAAAAVLLCFSSARAHFNMLLPDKHSVKKGEDVAFTYQWGHPFEHQLFDAPEPADVYVISPDGKKTDLRKKLEEAKAPAGEKKEVTVYRFRFQPSERGDYVFVLKTPLIWMEEEKEYWQDRVKVVLHVQAQKGWDATTGDDKMELIPLSRPYGLEPGIVFQAQALGRLESRADSQPDAERKVDSAIRTSSLPLPKALVEIERYSSSPPKALPPDEQITRTAKTDPNGVVTCTLTEPGWWCIAAHRDFGTQERDGKEYPIRQRAIHWVFVDDKPAAK
jgi:uncharacterized GH25 family protein